MLLYLIDTGGKSNGYEKVLDNLSRRLFAYEYEEFIRVSVSEYHQKPDMCQIESSYNNAKTLLYSDLTNPQRQAFLQMEAQYEYRQSYAAKFGFYCGIYAAFEEHFNNGMTDFYTFRILVQEGLLQKTGMLRHPDFLASFNKSMDIAARLDAEKPSCAAHLSAVLLALEERVQSSALLSFYCGYRAALSLMEHIMPLNRADIVSHIQMVEYELGLAPLCNESEK